jgi:hypothetical protein
MNPAYAICRYVRHYHAKNGYAPKRAELGCEAEFVDKLVANGVLRLLPLYEGGPPIAVVLTDKGSRMADG